MCSRGTTIIIGIKRNLFILTSLDALKGMHLTCRPCIREQIVRTDLSKVGLPLLWWRWESKLFSKKINLFYDHDLFLQLFHLHYCLTRLKLNTLILNWNFVCFIATSAPYGRSDTISTIKEIFEGIFNIINHKKL